MPLPARSATAPRLDPRRAIGLVSAIELAWAIEPESVIGAQTSATDARTVLHNYPPIGPTESATAKTGATPFGVMSPRICHTTAAAFGEAIPITRGGA